MLVVGTELIYTYLLNIHGFGTQDIVKTYYHKLIINNTIKIILCQVYCCGLLYNLANFRQKKETYFHMSLLYFIFIYSATTSSSPSVFTSSTPSTTSAFPTKQIRGKAL